MNKNFKFYAVIWAVLFVLFNIISFVSVGWIWFDKYTPSFWIGYIFIILAFAGQLLCAYKAFKAENIKKLFYNIPLITISYRGLVLSFVFGGACMIISPLPYFVGVIACAIILAVTAVAVIKASLAAEIVSEVDKKVTAKTLFIKSLAADAEKLLVRAKNNEVKDLAKKVFDAIRYSDPMSSEELGHLELKIENKFLSFADAVTKDDIGNAKSAADELVILINDRNKKCMLLK